MDDDITTPISEYDSETITIRGRSLAEEIMGETNFGEAAFLIATGRIPDEGESELVNTMLASLLAHGMTSHAVVTRLTYGAAPDSVEGAVAAGVLGIGPRSAGAVRPCAETLQSLVAAEDTATLVEAMVDDAEPAEPFGVSGFPGVGHGYFDESDPRADVILETADRVGVSGDHVALLRELRSAFEERTGEHLPINVVGAIAAAGSDLGLSPIVAQGIAILSRTAGLVAEVDAEAESPASGAIRGLVGEHVEYRPDRP